MMGEQEGMLQAQQAKMFEEIRAHSVDLRQMTQSKGWQIWMDWVKTSKEGLAQVALRDASPQAREEARMELLALEKFERIPLLLVDLTQEG